MLFLIIESSKARRTATRKARTYHRTLGIKFSKHGLPKAAGDASEPSNRTAAAKLLAKAKAKRKAAAARSGDNKKLKDDAKKMIKRSRLQRKKPWQGGDPEQNRVTLP